eukprot:TRINITY_DN56687_c0_g1_i1.p1 TRINITY_DN56687_c0_g1~~TRINITY_DN56687_c0_g1_i1.p1  ORF type:complete len:718 (+),score=111.18 TRINITY_DN56687_c0_g1_i1:120-2273(+)
MAQEGDGQAMPMLNYVCELMEAALGGAASGLGAYVEPDGDFDHRQVNVSRTAKSIATPSVAMRVSAAVAVAAAARAAQKRRLAAKSNCAGKRQGRKPTSPAVACSDDPQVKRTVAQPQTMLSGLDWCDVGVHGGSVTTAELFVDSCLTSAVAIAAVVGARKEHQDLDESRKEQQDLDEARQPEFLQETHAFSDRMMRRRVASANAGKFVDDCLTAIVDAAAVGTSWRERTAATAVVGVDGQQAARLAAKPKYISCFSLAASTDLDTSSEFVNRCVATAVITAAKAQARREHQGLNDTPKMLRTQPVRRSTSTVVLCQFNENATSFVDACLTAAIESAATTRARRECMAAADIAGQDVLAEGQRPRAPCVGGFVRSAASSFCDFTAKCFVEDGLSVPEVATAPAVVRRDHEASPCSVLTERSQLDFVSAGSAPTLPPRAASPGRENVSDHLWAFDYQVQGTPAQALSARASDGFSEIPAAPSKPSRFSVPKSGRRRGQSDGETLRAYDSSSQPLAMSFHRRSPRRDLAMTLTTEAQPRTPTVTLVPAAPVAPRVTRPSSHSRRLSARQSQTPRECEPQAVSSSSSVSWARVPAPPSKAKQVKRIVTPRDEGVRAMTLDLMGTASEAASRDGVQVNWARAVELGTPPSTAAKPVGERKLTSCLPPIDRLLPTPRVASGVSGVFRYTSSTVAPPVGTWCLGRGRSSSPWRLAASGTTIVG